MKPIACPECGSENIQRAHIVYAAGTTHSQGSSVSVGAAFSGGGTTLLSGISATEHTHRTALANRISPPAKKPEDYRAESTLASARIVRVIAIVVGLLGIASWDSGAFLMIVLFVAASLIWYFHEKSVKAAKKRLAEIKHYNGSIWPPEYEKWKTNWFCHKCGYFGVVRPSDS